MIKSKELKRIGAVHFKKSQVVSLEFLIHWDLEIILKNNFVSLF